MWFQIAVEITSSSSLGPSSPCLPLQPAEENAAQYGFITVYQHLCSALTLPKTKLSSLYYDLLIPFSIGRLTYLLD